MNDKFDELAKGLARSVTRRGALKEFGLGVVGLALAVLGLANKAEADPGGGAGSGNCNHCSGAPYYGCAPDNLACIKKCTNKCCVNCPK
jgi:hypothetical protein